MKKIIGLIFIASVLISSCNQKPKPTGIEKKMLDAFNNSKTQHTEFEVDLSQEEIRGIKTDISKKLYEKREGIDTVKFILDNDPLLRGCFQHYVKCDGIKIDSFLKCIGPLTKTPTTHSVTAEIPLGKNGNLSAKTNVPQYGICGFQNDCIPILPDSTVYLGAFVQIKIPCEQAKCSSPLNLKMKVFSNTKVSIKNFQAEYLNGKKDSFKNSISYDDQSESIQLDISNEYYRCQDSCFLDIAIYFDFVPKFISNCRPYKHVIAIQLEYNPLINHNTPIESKLDHKPANFHLGQILPKGITGVPAKKRSEYLESFVINPNLYTAICKSNPTTLADFRSNNSEVCGHLADHTIVLDIPLCTTHPDDQISELIFLNGNGINQVK